jgi:hypothetical protein
MPGPSPGCSASLPRSGAPSAECSSTDANQGGHGDASGLPAIEPLV